MQSAQELIAILNRNPKGCNQYSGPECSGQAMHQHLEKTVKKLRQSGHTVTKDPASHGTEQGYFVKKNEPAQEPKKGSWLKTAGKAGLIAGGALAGGVLGARVLSSTLGKSGRVLQAGERLTGKVLTTTKGHILPSSLISTKSGLTLDRVLRHTARRPGFKGELARAAQKLDEFLSIPQVHYGVGVDRSKIADYSMSGVEKKGKTEFGKFWNRTWEDPANTIRVISEGPVKGTKGSARKAAEKALKARHKEASKWKADDICGTGDKTCETFAHGISSGNFTNKTMRHAKMAIAGGATAGAGAGTAGALQLDRVENVLTVINGGPGSGFHGHKGIPGHRGGSASEGGGIAVRSGQVSSASRMLGYTAPTSAERAHSTKSTFTKTSKLAEVFGTHANELERKYKSKWFPIGGIEEDRLADIHQKAADYYRGSAEQATLVKAKGVGVEDQLRRLELADHHQTLADKHYSKAGKKASRSKVAGDIGRSFVRGLVGSTIEELPGRAGEVLGDIARETAVESVHGGIKAAGKKGASYDSVARAIGEAARKQTDLKSMRRRVETAIEKAKTRKAMSKLHEQALFQGAIRKASGETAAERNARYRVALREERAREKASKGPSSSSGNPPPDLAEKMVAAADAIKASNEHRDRELELAEESKKTTTNASEHGHLSSVTANLAGSVRRETLHGKDYLVAPLTMIVQGVLNGSKGPLFYPEAEIKNNHQAWNGIPIVVNHPTENGVPVPARSPRVLERHQIGTVFNAQYNDKLVAEGWFDVERTRKVNSSVYDWLLNGTPIELSTGLYTDNEPYEGVWNGRAYKFIARNYRPDHLAILIGSRGACSVKDGCGVLVNKDSKPVNEIIANIIRKVGDKYCVLSEKGKNLGGCGSILEAKKRLKEVEYFKHKHISNEVRQLTEQINNSYMKAAGELGSAVFRDVGKAGRLVKKMGLGGLAKGGVGLGKKAVKAGTKFTRRYPKTSLAVAGTGAYKAGQWDSKKQTRNALSAKAKGRLKMGAGFAGGFGAGMGGAVGGAKLGALAGSALAPVTGGLSIPIGGIIGGAAGAAAGTWGAHKVAKKVGGSKAGNAAAVGGMVGSIATPGGIGRGIARGVSRLAGRKVAQTAATTVAKKSPGLVSRLAGSVRKGDFKAAGAVSKRIGMRAGRTAGKMGLDMGTYGGTTAGLEATSRKFSKPHKPRAVVQNAWTEEARRRAIEARRRKVQLDTRPRSRRDLAIAAGAAGGAITGRVGMKMLEPEIDRGIKASRKAIGSGALRLLKLMKGR